jgi:hypothetical protein
MPFDLAIIGIVIALILLIIFFSAVVLYLAFRIKETFRKETSRGATIAKIGFLIGILFLAGGMFYFFANTLSNITGPTSTPSPNPTPPMSSPSPVPTPSPMPTPTPTPTPGPAPMPSPTPTPSPSPTLSMSISYPPSARMNTIITVSFTIINPTVSTAHGATIQADVLFAKFKIQSSTHEVVGNVVNIGDVPPGTTIVSLQLLAPNRAGIVTDTVSLLFQEMTTPIIQEITISVRGGF